MLAVAELLVFFKRLAMKKIVLTSSFIIAVVVLIVINGTNMESNKLLRIGFPAYWGTLIPSLQHTGYADALMANQFEALVTTGQGGMTTPWAAKSWKISDDFRVFTFTIDTERAFSNGRKLEAEDFKRSWEYGLSLDPKSANSSLQDVMYKIVGYEDFAKTGKLSGVRVLNNETLEVEFKKPFRMALNHLSGSRVSAFIKDEDKYYGTGPYIITEKDKELTLAKNPHSKIEVGFENIKVMVVPPPEAEAALKSDHIDLYALAEFANINSCVEGDTEISCYSGSEARHQAVIVNGMKGRFFENINHRQAIQKLIYSLLDKEKLPNRHKANLIIDPQIFLPLQTGRIENDEAKALVDSGEKYIDDLIKATQSNPIYMITSEETNWVQELLESKGMKFTDNSGWISTKERVVMYYKTYEPDLIVSAFSVASGDPDGIYHALGKNGSISSPIQYRKSVADLLEEGRDILDMRMADKHYQKVSKEALKDVPFVHLGFTKTIVAYRKDKVKVLEKYKKRDETRFSIFSPN